MICGQCKKEMPEEMKKSGELYKQCKKCRTETKCKHGRRKDKCRDCKGTGICKHKKLKYQCKECSTTSAWCKHNRRKYRCKECGGKGICKHNTRKDQCKECKGSRICIHNKQKHLCKQCKGSGICKHNKVKSICKECGGSQICKHNKQKHLCKQCKGKGICIHDREKSKCKECGGSQVCKHKKLKNQCKECKGASICVHDDYKKYCIICTPKNACTVCSSIFVPKYSKYYPMCARCYAYTYPDKKLPRKFKLKENIFFDAIREKYPDLEMKIRFDKKIDGSCSRKRPDIFIDCLTHVIIGELDENEHSRYEEICENRRIMELFTDIGNRPIIVLRLNPDSYYKDDEKYNGCFSYTKSGTISIDKKEWEKRMKLFTWHLDSWLTHIPRKEVTIRKFFYSK